MRDKNILYTSFVFLLALIAATFYPEIVTAGPPSSNLCCPTKTAPVGHKCPNTNPCDPGGSGYCVSCWQQGMDSAEEILDPIQNDPGGWLYGPAVGEQEFSTFDGSEQFKGNLHGDDAPTFLVGGFAVCFAEATTTGVKMLLKTMADPNVGTYLDVGSYTASGLGRQGFAVCPSSAENWDSIDAGGECEYYGWQFNPANNQITATVGQANKWSNATGRPPHLAFDNFTCTSPTLCDVTPQTVYLNWSFILNLSTSGIIDAITRDAPEFQISKYTAQSLPAECTAFNLVSYENKGGNSPVVDCWHGEGKIINCRSVGSLQSRYGTMEILSSSESYAINTTEKESFFYEDPTTGLQIRSPAGILIEQGEAHAEFGSSNRCRLYNFPFGSRESGWVNHLAKTQYCGQGDWNCIYDFLREYCARYEKDENCRLVEEFIDGIPSIQFGNNTNLVGERDGTCWIDTHTPLSAGDPALQPPDLTGTEFEELELYRVEDPNLAGMWWRCGDFNILDRRYICSADQTVDTDIAKDAAIHGKNLQAALDAKTMDVDVDLSTGIINSYTYKNETKIPLDSLDRPVSLGSDDNVVPCPPEEQSCIVTWQASNQIYADGRNRENITPEDMVGNPQFAPQGSKLKRQVRPCEISSSGTPICPYDPLFETIESACTCQNLVGDAIGALALVRTLSNDIKCQNADTGTYEYVDAYMEEVRKLKPSNCPEEPGDLTYSYYCGIINQTVSSSYAAVCSDQFHKRSQLTQLSLSNRPTTSLPLQPIKALLETDDIYQCKMSWEEKTAVAITPGPITPLTTWFDICYADFVEPARQYIQTHLNPNWANPPSELCSPPLNQTIYTGSRPEGGCGFDNWAITSGPNRVNNVNLDPFSSWPFGSVEMSFEIERAFDNNAANSFDCNSDGWLDCFSCTFREAGADCDRDCIADNDYARCPYIQGFDCNADNGIDYPTCEFRSAGRDCDNDCIRDDNYQLCSHITGYDCNGDGAKDYDTCTVRTAGYDFDGDCISDSTEQCITNATYCGTTSSWDYEAMGQAVIAWWTANPVGTVISWGCPGGTIERTATGDTYCYNGCRSVTVSGRTALQVGQSITAWAPYVCGSFDGYRISVAATCCGTAVAEGVDCLGTACADAACVNIDGYDCGLNGGAAGNYTSDGRIDDNIDYCPLVSEGYDCHGTPCADNECVDISGYDCGTNGGAAYNQTPDMVVDNNINYCARVESGYDCSGDNCDGNHPAISAFSNNRITGGTCDTQDNIADGECLVGNWRCGRFDEPDRCGYETDQITFTIPIENRSNEYYCRLLDTASSSFQVGEFYYPDEARFITEGCQETLNEIYFEGPVSVTEFGIDFSYKYIRYEDLIDMVARNRCEWRDPTTIASCGDNPYHDIGITDYVYVEDFSNPEIDLVN